MKRKLDYIIKEDKEFFERIVFRFYPRQSHCHSFNEEPPKTYEDIYKVYFSWAILLQDIDENGNVEDTKTLYREYCDECSRIYSIALFCNLLANGKEWYEPDAGEPYEILDNEFHSLGSGTSWVIHKIPPIYKISKQQENMYAFDLWGFSGKGFRFYLPHYRLKEFADYLQGCSDYMLVHGESI